MLLDADAGGNFGRDRPNQKNLRFLAGYEWILNLSLAGWNVIYRNRFKESAMTDVGIGDIDSQVANNSGQKQRINPFSTIVESWASPVYFVPEKLDGICPRVHLLLYEFVSGP